MSGVVKLVPLLLFMGTCVGAGVAKDAGAQSTSAALAVCAFVLFLWMGSE